MQTELNNVTSWDLALERLDNLIEDLQGHECEVLVLLAKERTPSTYVIGSEKGISFLQKHSTLAKDFLKFCIGDNHAKLDDLPKHIPVKVEMAEEECDSDATIDVPADMIRGTNDGSDTDIEDIEDIYRQDEITGGNTVDNRSEINSDVVIDQDNSCINDKHDVGIIENDDEITKENINNVKKKLKEDNMSNAKIICSVKNENISKQNEKRKMDSKIEQSCDKTLIDYLRDDFNQKFSLKLSDSRRVEELDSAVSNAILLYDNICSKEPNNWYNDKTGKCSLCNRKVLRTHIKRHVKEHKKTFEEVVVPCDECGLYLPKPYLLIHDCVKMEERYMPTHITPVETDFWSFIVIIETQYQWTGLARGIPCIKCGIKLKTLAHSREHLVKQHLKDYQCKLCSKVLQSYSQITNHTVEHGEGTDSNSLNKSDNGNFICNICGRQLTKRSSLRRHIERRHMPVERTYFPCTKCNRKFRTQNGLDRHAPYHEEKWTCTIEDCKAEYSSAQELTKHKRVVHKEHLKSKKFLCNICGRGFNRNGTLIAHMEWKHNTGQPQTCPICKKVCRGKAALRCHMGTHQDKVERQCEFCGKTFRTRNSLWKHKQKHHTEQTESYCCEVCGRTLKTLRSFNHHIIAQNHFTDNQTVKKEHIYKCAYCGKLFGIKDKLTAHITCVHIKNKQHNCEFCGKAFADRSNYRQHLKIHLGSKPTCKSCKMTFRSELKLKQHLEEHAHTAQQSPHIPDLKKYSELEAWKSDVTRESGTINYNTEPTENSMNVSVEIAQPYMYPLPDGHAPQFILEMKPVEPSVEFVEKEVGF